MDTVPKSIVEIASSWAENAAGKCGTARVAKASRGSFEYVRDAVIAEYNRTHKRPDGANQGAYIEETHADFVIVRDCGDDKWWMQPYLLDETGAVTLGVPVEVVRRETFEPKVPASNDAAVAETAFPVSKSIRMLVPVEKSDAPRRITLGVVLEPGTEDLQGDVMDPGDIELAAHDWMIDSQTVGTMHAAVAKGAKVVESYLAPCDLEVETSEGPVKVLKGSWLLAVKWPPEEWEKIEKGDYTGYSVGGQGVRTPLDEETSDE
jgi:hypothetical protein